MVLIGLDAGDTLPTWGKRAPRTSRHLRVHPQIQKWRSLGPSRARSGLVHKASPAGRGLPSQAVGRVSKRYHPCLLGTRLQRKLLQVNKRLLKPAGHMRAAMAVSGLINRTHQLCKQRVGIAGAPQKPTDLDAGQKGCCLLQRSNDAWMPSYAGL